ncbi:MAG: lipopolysaccharide kinase InaA family protein [Candidatus Aminicenantes bacterium]
MKPESGWPVFLPPFQGRIHPRYRNPQFLRALAGCEDLLGKPACRIIHQGRNRMGVLSLPWLDRKKVEVVIKEFRLRGVDRVKSIFLKEKAAKAWAGAQVLMERGVKTPQPVAYLEKRGKLGVERSYYVCQKLSGVEEIRFLFRRLSSSELRDLAGVLSRYISSWHSQGICHRDLSDGNILVSRDNQKYEFYLVDTNRIRIKKRIRLLPRIKNLIRLGIPGHSQRFFLAQYLETRHVPGWLWLWYRVNKAVYTFYVEWKKKLRLRQLARRLRIQ